MPTPEEMKKYRDHAWEVGELRWLLDDNQLGMHDFIFSCGRKRVVANCARRIGKTFLFCVIAIEQAIKKKTCRIKFAASTADDLEEIIIPIFEKILATCPEKLRPNFRMAKQKFTFPNGSTIKLAGCDDRRKANRLRGTDADVFIFEEAGSIPDLKYVVNSVAMPQLLETEGMMLFASTPPDSSGHEFVAIAEDAQAAGAYIHRTIYDCPRHSDAKRMKFFQEAAGSVPLDEYMKTEDYRREFMAEFITDASLAVLTHATEANIGKATDKGYVDGVVTKRYRALVKPEFFVPYQGGDYGWNPDKTGWLFAYWHFPEHTLVVEREILVQRMDTIVLCTDIEVMEKLLLGPERSARFRDGRAVYRRWADAPDQLLAEMAGRHNLPVFKTKKDDRDTAINNLNLMIPGHGPKLAINPDGCPQLLLQMKAATWKNANRVDFSRTRTHAHFDLVAALIYLARNIVQDEDPAPPGHGFNPSTHFRPEEPPEAISATAMSLQRALRGMLSA